MKISDLRLQISLPSIGASSALAATALSAQSRHRLRRRPRHRRRRQGRSTTPRIVVTGDRITQVGPAASIKAPAGATRVSLAGKTVMPAIVDTHVHTSTTAPELENDLRQRAHFGVGAALSMGLDGTDAATSRSVRKRRPGWLASSSRPRHHGAGEGPHRSALLDHHARGGPQGRPGECREEGRHHQDLGRRSRRQVPEADAAALRRRHRRSAQAEAAGHRAHLLARGRQGVAEGRHRQLRARHSRSRHGR